MALSERFELPTFAFEARRSNPLSYESMAKEVGLEPTFRVLETRVLTAALLRHV